jgi:hypothetical protein
MKATLFSYLPGGTGHLHINRKEGCHRISSSDNGEKNLKNISNNTLFHSKNRKTIVKQKRSEKLSL